MGLLRSSGVAIALAAGMGGSFQAANAGIIVGSAHTGSSPTVSNSDLINGLLPTAQSGSFGNEGTAGVTVLTDGSGGLANSSQAWTGIGSGSSLTYTLAPAAAGYDISEIDVYTGWGDFGRANPQVTVSYSLVGSPTSFTVLGTNTQPNFSGGGSGVWTNVAFTPDSPLSNVAAIKFDFPNQQNGYVGYRELDVLGAASAVSAVPEPASLGLLGVAGTLLLRRRRA